MYSRVPAWSVSDGTGLSVSSWADTVSVQPSGNLAVTGGVDATWPSSTGGGGGPASATGSVGPFAAGAAPGSAATGAAPANAIDIQAMRAAAAPRSIGGPLVNARACRPDAPPAGTRW